MKRFVTQHQNHVVGILTGFDRLLFRGTLRSLCHTQGMSVWLSCRGILLKDFVTFAKGLSQRLKEHAQALAQQRQRPYWYVGSSAASKEKLARSIQQRDNIQQGLICVLAAVEPCFSYSIRSQGGKIRRLRLHWELRKCLHLYFYFMDRELGFFHIRLQTWFPFTIQVCLNGREWLARQLDRRGIGYERRDNCFTRVADWTVAQQLLDRQLQRRWAGVLGALARCVNPLLAERGLSLRSYYWTVAESEFATDIVFRHAHDLATLYPPLVRHAMEHFHCDDILRFLGRRIQPARFEREVRTDLRRRVEGVRIKHWVEENSIKMYDKQGCVLRVEVTINNAKRFRVYRRVKRNGHLTHRWVPMRRGLPDVARRVQISRAANERYLEALSVVHLPSASCDVLDPVCQRVTRKGRSYRALSPVSPQDHRRLAMLLDGRFLLHDFCHRDLISGFLPPDQPPARDKKMSGRITRWLQLLSAHGLVYRLSHTHRYRVSKRGHKVIATANILRSASPASLAA